MSVEHRRGVHASARDMLSKIGENTVCVLHCLRSEGNFEWGRPRRGNAETQWNTDNFRCPTGLKQGPVKFSGKLQRRNVEFSGVHVRDECLSTSTSLISPAASPIRSAINNRGREVKRSTKDQGRFDPGTTLAHPSLPAV